MIRVRVVGDRALIAKCARARRQLGDLTPPTRAAGRAVERTARRLAPRRTGRLSRSIRATVAAGHARIGTTIRYAPYVEHGTTKMRARPYLGPAIAGTNVVAPFAEYANTIAREFN